MQTNEDFLKCFEEGMVKTAEFISWLANYKLQLERISNITMDNADPECEAAECLERLGVLLSTLTIYKDEYTKEPWKIKSI
jgi:hypothetical protein